MLSRSLKADMKRTNDKNNFHSYKPLHFEPLHFVPYIQHCYDLQSSYSRRSSAMLCADTEMYFGKYNYTNNNLEGSQERKLFTQKIIDMKTIGTKMSYCLAFIPVSQKFRTE